MKLKIINSYVLNKFISLITEIDKKSCYSKTTLNLFFLLSKQTQIPDIFTGRVQPSAELYGVEHLVVVVVERGRAQPHPVSRVHAVIRIQQVALEHL